MPFRLLAVTGLLLSTAAVAAPPPLDVIASDYVKLSLEAGEREPEYVDAYYGSADWATAAKANPRSLAQLLADARTLKAATAAVDPKTLKPMDVRRRTFLLAMLTAAETRLAMANGRHFDFAEEARGLFGVAPDLKPLASYDPVLADIDTIVPGDGPLWQRVNAYRESLAIPTDRLKPVMAAAINECRARTLAHIKLPADEHFTLEFVTKKPWGGYNYYKGNAVSVIQVNTDLPVLITRAVDLGCHEGYPGHHLLNMLLEQKLSRGRGWQEFTVLPLYSPMGFIAEGTANYGIELAFPGNEREAFEETVLFPLAGLDPAQAKRSAALAKAMQKLAGARFTIARDYLDGHLTREQAIAASQKYELLSRPRAEKSVGFFDHYRSYVINYGLGRDMAAATVEAAGNSPAARWQAFETLLSEPTVAGDLRPPR